MGVPDGAGIGGQHRHLRLSEPAERRRFNWVLLPAGAILCGGTTELIRAISERGVGGPIGLQGWSKMLITTEGALREHEEWGAAPVHPGEVLREYYLVPPEMSANALAKALSVPAPRINDIVREQRGVSADTAMCLARYFGGDALSWLNLQAAFDLRVAEIANAERIEREIVPSTA